MLRNSLRLLATALLAAPLAARAQGTPDTAGSFITSAGVLRAAGVVDSVFVARSRDSALVDPGDWTAYLMARLGVSPIPTMGLRVTSDSTLLRVRGRVRDLPPEAQRALSPLLAMLDPGTPLEATVRVDQPASHAVRFHLDSAYLGGIPVPEGLLGPALRAVGSKYTVLANGGRDLFVEVPPYGQVRFAANAVRLLGPPSPSPATGPARRGGRRGGSGGARP
ncbi:MAG TPA: hypothetical protein VFS07_05875 [Gemmatimonadales bacterium]|nr:hypothetical protein [Gemmatimonadales bacterium]